MDPKKIYALMFAEYLKDVQINCTPKVWSQGVTWNRGETRFIKEAASTEDEIIVRVLIKNRPISSRVMLWPDEGDWGCDCDSSDDPCAHVAAVVIAIKRQGLELAGVAADPEPKTSASGTSTTSVPLEVPEIHYRFLRGPQGLLLERWIVKGSFEKKLENSNLAALVAGIQSGRVNFPQIPATRVDFEVDHLLATAGKSYLDRRTLLNLMRSFENAPHVTLDGKPLKVSPQTIGIQARLIEDGEGFRLQRFQNAAVQENFGNGIVLSNGSLRCVEHSRLTPSQQDLLTSAGRYFGPQEAARLVLEILPELEKKIPLEVLTSKLPKTREMQPSLQLVLESVDRGARMSVLAKLVYGSPVVAQVNAGQLQMLDAEFSKRNLLIRNENSERQLLQRLQTTLQLQTGRRVELQASDAIDFVKKLPKQPFFEVSGDGLSVFSASKKIEPKVVIDGKRFDMSFEILGSGGELVFADPARVFRAWREGSDHVPLLDGSWAELPRDWLKRYGKKIADMLAARDAKQELPAFKLPELANLCEELGQNCPPDLSLLRDRLGTFDGIPASVLPADLTADLRSYQLKGVNWLCFLRDTGLGAMLADDMGLGKTLQALCAISGRTLVVCPTSVLFNWQAEIHRFRPSLKVAVYYGSGRKMDLDADVVLTSYAVLRLDQSQLANPSRTWDMMIIDEAQTIKNPDSQVARAVHSVTAQFKVSLSGTPVENRLDDLWSQFQFINPGLLGARSDFEDQFARPIARGDTQAAALLRARIRPFILRRLKKEVAPELPARTELVLTTELNADERNLYDSLLASTRKEVLAKMEEGGSIMAALELILRLRQSCCHQALIPGALAPGEQVLGSSKLDLLLESLEEGLSEGHKSLVFSQWTSFLDLIQTELEKRRIPFLRIDGSTQNRQDIVRTFQSGGDDTRAPKVMLISLKAGGVGLTLTAADHVYIMDPWWNPAVEDQAADRAHRIGQQNPVMIHKLVAQDTIEEKIIELQKKKKDLASAVLDEGAGAALSITRDDILQLLG